MNLCCTCDDNYVLPLRVMLESLSCCDSDITLWLVYSDISDANLGAIASDVQLYGWSFRAVKIDDDTTRLCESLPKIQYFSKEVYYRLLLPWILCECDRVLYMDCDTLVRGSLAELYAIEMEGAVIAAVPDNSNMTVEKANKARLGLMGRYCNSGVLLIDCAMVRGRFTRAQMASAIADTAAENDLIYPDQDLINMIYDGDIKILDKIWNLTTNLKTDFGVLFSRSEMREVKVFHFIGPTKPWHSEYIRWFVFEYWGHLKKFLPENEKRAYWKRKKFVCEQFKRIPEIFEILRHKMGR